MQTIMHRELRNHSAAILRRVQAGETFEITNNGEPVAILSPISQDRLSLLRRRGATRGATQVDFRALKRTSELASQEVLDDLRGER
ncbi:type II toxin-antitoxin system prevent-host-death family antitoxin [Actinomyces viscosus]|uniref:type II toxin-antitoxin system Phd/YefM family antitoxin n=1 Tax=Actinomyces viscosus TaxID=1656 RepID=UPI0028E86D79|nr:type II toxin-antitoxin system prevent-host-death family antitoxin [Actinomyces viscosus]